MNYSIIKIKHMKNLLKNSSSFIVLLFLFSNHITAQDKESIIGKWDLNVQKGNHIAPSWLQVVLSGSSTLVGYFVEYNGSARPISEVHFHNGIIDFTIPPQWNGNTDLHFSGKLENGKLKGTILGSDAIAYPFEGVRAPKLVRAEAVNFGKPKSLFSGKNIKGWHPENQLYKSNWIAKDGVLKNTSSGSNLVTDETFEDFQLHLEVRYPKGSNSGIYLRGRYEVQVEDGYGKDPNSIFFGAIYGFLTPNEMAANPPGEWQVFDITLIGRRVTIMINGKTVINDQSIPGITGGALDSNEGAPGPIMLQGDHGAVEYRNISIRTPQ